MNSRLHVYYRHVHIDAEKYSRDPGKARPDWFTYEVCFRNILSTIRSDPQAQRVTFTIMFDGSVEKFQEDFVSRYHANPDLGLQLQFLAAGSDKVSAFLTLHHIAAQKHDDGDLVYMVENDYMHRPGWVSRLFELYESKLQFNYVSLYDHADKYFLAMYEGLEARIHHTANQHWRTAPSTCGSFIATAAQFRQDFDVMTSGLPDYAFFQSVVNDRQRVLLTPVPGLSTHCMAGYLSPTVRWEDFIY